MRGEACGRSRQRAYKWKDGRPFGKLRTGKDLEVHGGVDVRV